MNALSKKFFALSLLTLPFLSLACSQGQDLSQTVEAIGAAQTEDAEPAAVTGEEETPRFELKTPDRLIPLEQLKEERAPAIGQGNHNSDDGNLFVQVDFNRPLLNGTLAAKLVDRDEEDEPEL